MKAWIDKQVPNFRLNFFVDEVGQYIADNVKLMTNLQTIAESLNTKCKGQAWMIVTSQQDMEAIIGDGNGVPVSGLLEDHGAVRGQDAAELGGRGRGDPAPLAVKDRCRLRSRWAICTTAKRTISRPCSTSPMARSS